MRESTKETTVINCLVPSRGSRASQWHMQPRLHTGSHSSVPATFVLSDFEVERLAMMRGQRWWLDGRASPSSCSNLNGNPAGTRLGIAAWSPQLSWFWCLGWRCKIEALGISPKDSNNYYLLLLLLLLPLPLPLPLRLPLPLLLLLLLLFFLLSTNLQGTVL